MNMQPLLHDLVATYSAPVQAWSCADGQISAHSINGVYLADTRLLSQAVLATDYEMTPIQTDVRSATETAYVSVLRKVGMTIDPEFTLTRTRTVTSDDVREEFTITNSSSQTFTATLTLTAVADGAPMDNVKSGEADGFAPELNLKGDHVPGPPAPHRPC